MTNQATLTKQLFCTRPYYRVVFKHMKYHLIQTTIAFLGTMVFFIMHIRRLKRREAKSCPKITQPVSR